MKWYSSVLKVQCQIIETTRNKSYWGQIPPVRSCVIIRFGISLNGHYTLHCYLALVLSYNGYSINLVVNHDISKIIRNYILLSTLYRLFCMI